MSQNQPRHDPETRGEVHHDEVPDDAMPTTNQPLNAEPRPRFTPAMVAGLLVAMFVVIVIVVGFL